MISEDRVMILIQGQVQQSDRPTDRPTNLQTDRPQGDSNISLSNFVCWGCKHKLKCAATNTCTMALHLHTSDAIYVIIIIIANNINPT